MFFVRISEPVETIDLLCFPWQSPIANYLQGPDESLVWFLS